MSKYLFHTYFIFLWKFAQFFSTSPVWFHIKRITHDRVSIFVHKPTKLTILVLQWLFADWDSERLDIFMLSTLVVVDGNNNTNIQSLVLAAWKWKQTLNFRLAGIFACSFTVSAAASLFCFSSVPRLTWKWKLSNLHTIFSSFALLTPLSLTTHNWRKSFSRESNWMQLDSTRLSSTRWNEKIERKTRQKILKFNLFF